MTCGGMVERAPSGRPCILCGRLESEHIGEGRICPVTPTFRAPVTTSARCAAVTTVNGSRVRCERDDGHDGAHRFTLPTRPAGWGA